MAIKGDEEKEDGRTDDDDDRDLLGELGEE